MASTAWIAFVDADVTPCDEWLGLLLAHTGEDIVAVAPRVVCAPEAGGVSGLVERWSGALDLGATPTDVGPGMPVSFVPTAMLLVRRAALESAGGFDEGLQVGEDVDLVWRLRSSGRVRYEPDVVCTHAPRTSLRSVLGRRFAYGTSAAALERRHPGAVRHADVSLWSLLPWAIGIVVHPVAGIGAAALTTAMAPRALPGLPATDATLLAARGHLLSAAALGRYLARPLWPLTAIVIALMPARRFVILGAVLAGTADSVRRWVSVDRLDPATVMSVAKVIGGGVLDDAAYSAGVWAGCVRERRWGPLLPRIRAGSVRRTS